MSPQTPCRKQDTANYIHTGFSSFRPEVTHFTSTQSIGPSKAHSHALGLGEEGSWGSGGTGECSLPCVQRRTGKISPTAWRSQAGFFKRRAPEPLGKCSREVGGKRKGYLGWDPFEHPVPQPRPPAFNSDQQFRLLPPSSPRLAEQQVSFNSVRVSWGRCNQNTNDCGLKPHFTPHRSGGCSLRSWCQYGWVLGQGRLPGL